MCNYLLLKFWHNLSYEVLMNSSSALDMIRLKREITQSCSDSSEKIGVRWQIWRELSTHSLLSEQRELLKKSRAQPVLNPGPSVPGVSALTIQQQRPSQTITHCKSVQSCSNV